MNLIERATALRSSAELGARYLPDEKALQAKVLYKQWSELVLIGSVTADAGYKFLHGEDLYKCINANPTFQADWVPGVGTESLYTRIDEIHAGSNGHHHHTHSYHITFEKEGGERLELKVKRYEYNELSIGDRGVLTHQGTRYKGFER